MIIMKEKPDIYGQNHLPDDMRKPLKQFWKIIKKVLHFRPKMSQKEVFASKEILW